MKERTKESVKLVGAACSGSEADPWAAQMSDVAPVLAGGGGMKVSPGPLTVLLRINGYEIALKLVPAL